MTDTKTMTKMDRLAYRGPEFNEHGVKVTRFTVGGEKEDFFSFMRNLVYEQQGRGCNPGTYHRLDVDGTLWMSDTTAERRDHMTAIRMADLHPGGTGLVNGLGMGCVVGAMLDVLDHVDVVENDGSIYETLGQWYIDQYGDRVTIHFANAKTIEWPKGKRWDVVWHDIWPDIGSDNLPEMTTLHRRYGKRCNWQGSWCRAECEQVRRDEQDPYGWFR